MHTLRGHLIGFFAVTTALIASSCALVVAASPSHAEASLTSGSYGNVVTWGDSTPGNDTEFHDTFSHGENVYGLLNLPSDLADVTLTQVAASSEHSMALDTDGNLYVWGFSGEGTTPPSSLAGEHVTDMATASSGQQSNFIALSDDGRVTHWGSLDGAAVNSAPWSPEPSSLATTEVVDVAAGVASFAALTAEGTVVTWGRTDFSVAPPPGLTGVVKIDAEGELFAAVKDDGTAVVWGSPAALTGVGATPPMSGVVDVRVGANQLVALLGDGTIRNWGWNSYQAATVPAALTGKTVVAVDSGERMSAVVTDDGHVVQWGYDGFSGTSDVSDSAVAPASIAGTVVRSVAVGTRHVVAVTVPEVTTTAPAVLGTVAVGQTLTAQSPTVTPGTATVAYEWWSEGVSRGVGPSYVVQLGDVGKTLVVRAAVTAEGFTSATADSEATTVVPGVVTSLKATATALGKGRVRFVVSVTAPGVARADRDGALTIKVGRTKLLAEPLVNGRGRYVVTSIAPGRRTFVVSWKPATPPGQMTGAKTILRKVSVS